MARAPAVIQVELDEAKDRRRITAGVQATAFGDQSTTFDHKALDKHIADLERELGEVSETRRPYRVAAFDKGV